MVQKSVITSSHIKRSMKEVATMQIINKKLYDEWHTTEASLYETAVVTYADELAELIEEKMKQRPLSAPQIIIPEYAETVSKIMDEKYSISGYQYDCAIQYLAEIWKYGKILEKWYNKKH